MRIIVAVGTGILVIAALMFGSVSFTAEARSKPSALQLTATPVAGFGTTVTPIPGAKPPLSGPALYSSFALRTVVWAAILFGLLYFAFHKPSTHTAKNFLSVLIGFLAWFGVNTLLWKWVLSGEPGTLFINPFRLIPLLATLAVLFLSFISQRYVTLGLVCAILVNAIALVLFNSPSQDIMDPDQSLERAFAMVPFYIPFFFPAI